MCYHTSVESKQQLIMHVARLEGQLAAVRSALEVDDCSKAARTLLAASRSLTSLRAACAGAFISTRIYKYAKVSDTKLLEDVRALMRA